jgi:hypothetical protein
LSTARHRLIAAGTTCAAQAVAAEDASGR